MARPYAQNAVIRWLRDLLCGFLIGAGAILPGVSGGVLAVVFDIYRPFMEVLTRPRTAIPKYWKWFPPIALGWCAGFLGFAKGIATAMNLSDTVTIWLFIGLIVGTVPSLFREAGKEGRSAVSWASLLLCAAAIFAGLFYVSRILCVTVKPNFWWYNFCGVLWGVSIVIPGMTSSSVMFLLMTSRMRWVPASGAKVSPLLRTRLIWLSRSWEKLSIRREGRDRLIRSASV